MRNLNERKSNSDDSIRMMRRMRKGCYSDNFMFRWFETFFWRSCISNWFFPYFLFIKRHKGRSNITWNFFWHFSTRVICDICYVVPFKTLRPHPYINLYFQHILKHILRKVKNITWHSGEPVSRSPFSLPTL